MAGDIQLQCKVVARVLLIFFYCSESMKWENYFIAIAWRKHSQQTSLSSEKCQFSTPAQFSSVQQSSPLIVPIHIYLSSWIIIVLTSYITAPIQAVQLGLSCDSSIATISWFTSPDCYQVLSLTLHGMCLSHDWIQLNVSTQCTIVLRF